MSQNFDQLVNVYSTTKTAHKNVLVGIGHPLLDISVEVPLSFLDKYGLKKNDMQLCPPEKMSIYDEIEENYKLQFLPGGASMNAIRAAQWALKNQSEAVGATFCTGTVGSDKNADRMTSAAIYAGVATKYFKISEAFEDENEPKRKLATGSCAVLLTEDGKNRSLVTNLAAARTYPTKFLDKLWDTVEEARYFYAPGFFLSTENGQGLEVLKKIGQHCLENNKSFITNISAPFICTVFKKELAKIMELADVVFGNDFEYLAWGEANPDLVPEEHRKDLKFINKVVANLPRANDKKPRLAITTRGHLSTLVSQSSDNSNSEVLEVPILDIPKDEFVDTNGAGDAFVAGFMCGLIYNQSIYECLQCGNKVAGSIIRMNGCTFPQESLLKF